MRLFFSLGLGFICYLVLIFLYSESGLIAYKNLYTYHTQLKHHIANLEQNINSLEDKLASLYYSEEDLTSKLRDLNYFKKDDYVIFLPFNSSSKKSNPNLKILKYSHKNLFTSSFFWISFFMLSFFFYTMWKFFKDLTIGIPYVIFKIKLLIMKIIQFLKFYFRRKNS